MNPYKIYIVGEVPRIISKEIIEKFDYAEKQLKIFDVKTINPLENLLNTELKYKEAFKKNIIALTGCNAIYLLNENNNFYYSSVELKLAFALNLVIFHQPNDYQKTIKQE